MTKYIEIKGHSLQSVATDPEVYTNSWSSGGTMNTSRSRGFGTGTQTAGLASGGTAPGGVTANTEEYNGSSWTESGDLPSARGQGAAGGTQTAACLTGGQISDGTNQILLYN